MFTVRSLSTMIIGIFVFWQLGAMSYLDKHYDLSRVSMTGASAGAITIACAASKVDCNEFVEKMIAKCEEIKVWERRLGVIGVLGEIARDTLERTLPEDSHEKVNGSQVSVLIQPANPFEPLEKVSKFRSRKSIVNVLSASAQVPYLADGNLHTKFRGKSYIDGALFARDEDFLDEDFTDVPTLRFQHTEDPSLPDTSLIDCVVTPTKQEIWELYRKGQTYAKYRESLGDLSCLTPTDEGESRRQGIVRQRRRSSRLSQLRDNCLEVSEGTMKAFSRNTIHLGVFVVAASCLTMILVALWMLGAMVARPSLQSWDFELRPLFDIEVSKNVYI